MPPAPQGKESAAKYIKRNRKRITLYWTSRKQETQFLSQDTVVTQHTLDIEKNSDLHMICIVSDPVIHYFFLFQILVILNKKMVS